MAANFVSVEDTATGVTTGTTTGTTGPYDDVDNGTTDAAAEQGPSPTQCLAQYRQWEDTTGLRDTGSLLTVEVVHVRPTTAAAIGSRIAMSPVRRSHRTTDAGDDASLASSIATSAVTFAIGTKPGKDTPKKTADAARACLLDPTSPCAAKALAAETGLPFRPNPALNVRVASERAAGPRILNAFGPPSGAVGGGIACTPRRRALTGMGLMACGLPPMSPTPVKLATGQRVAASARKSTVRKAAMSSYAVRERGDENDDEEDDDETAAGEGDVQDDVMQQLLFGDE